MNRRVGAVLEDRYELTAMLGSGGMGTVYLARDRRLDRLVVVKFPHSHLLEDESIRNRFAREIRSLIDVHHPHIVRILDAGEDDGVPFAVMEFLPGGDLGERLRAAGDRMSLPDILSWLQPVAWALDHLHQAGVLHRDVKPGNILFDAEGSPYIGDFGIATGLEVDRTRLTGTGDAAGSPAYMAPESLSRNFTPAYDQYSLAAVVYHALTGRLPAPFGISDTYVETLEAQAPAPVAQAILRALAAEPDRRYSSCRAFAQALGQAAEEPRPLGQAAEEPRPQDQAVGAPRAAPHSRRRKWVIWAVLSAVGAALVLGTIFRFEVLRLIRPGRGPQPFDGTSPEAPRTPMGTMFLEGRVKLVSVSEPAADRATLRMVLQNETAETVRGVRATLLVRYLADPSGVAASGVREESRNIDFEPHEPVVWELPVSVSEQFTGYELRLSTTLAPTLQGDFFLDGRLECVELKLDLTSADPIAEYSFVNRGPTPVVAVRQQVVLSLQGREIWRSAWLPAFPNLAAGARASMSTRLPQLAGLGGATVSLLLDESPVDMVVEATGPWRLNGRQVEDDLPVDLRVGDRVTGQVRIAAAGGDQLWADGESDLEIRADTEGQRWFVLHTGRLVGTLSRATRVETPVGFVSVVGSDRCEVNIGTAEGGSTYVGSARGEVQVSVPRGSLRLADLQGADVTIAKGSSIVISSSRESPGTVVFTGALSARIDYVLEIPQETTVSVREVEEGKRLRIEVAQDSWPPGEVRVTTRNRNGTVQSGTLTPGTLALIDRSSEGD